MYFNAAFPPFNGIWGLEFLKITSEKLLNLKLGQTGMEEAQDANVSLENMACVLGFSWLNNLIDRKFCEHTCFSISII